MNAKWTLGRMLTTERVIGARVRLWDSGHVEIDGVVTGIDVEEPRRVIVAWDDGTKSGCSLDRGAEFGFDNYQTISGDPYVRLMGD